MRCYLAPEQWTGMLLHLPPDESHYLAQVLRLRAGDAIEVFDGCGRSAATQVVEAAKKSVCVRVLSEARSPRRAPRVELLQAVPKGKRMDLVLEKATELGASAIRPLWTERTVVRAEDERAERKVGHWREIILSAARQCGEAWLPELALPQPLGELLAKRNALPEMLVLGDLDEGAESLRACLRRAREAGVESLGLLIGPEGDFSPSEKEAIRAAGAYSVNMGPTVLRTETAALFGLSAIRYEWL